MKKVTSIIIGLALMSVSSFIWAGETPNRFQQFQQDALTAYASYRNALFQTSKQDQAASLTAAKQFQEQWQGILGRYADAPPEIFQADPAWSATLAEIGQIAEQSVQILQAGNLGEAHEKLEAIRNALGELHRRNQVITFSDHINNYHAQMEHLLEQQADAAKLDTPALNSIREQLAVLEYLAGQIQANAPQDYRANAEFQQLLEGNLSVLKALRQGLEEQSPEAINKAIQNLKPAYSKLFVKFG